MITPRLETYEMIKLSRVLLTTLIIVLGSANHLHAQETATPTPTNSTIELKESPVQASEFIELLTNEDPIYAVSFLERLENNWQDNLVPMVFETMNYIGANYIRNQMYLTFRTKTGYEGDDNPNEWYQWWWNKPENITKDYAQFKAELYKFIDPVFQGYFDQRQESARIRLDEIRWGGVRQDGIPPLRNPAMISAEQADYLEDSNIVFGVKINGEARAYPKRILAWHEMFTDTFDGEPIAGVYCTLCGTIIIYKTKHKGVEHNIGTSGFLYRSNKLMYDRETQSLWNTVRGEPVLGPLVDKGIALEHLSVVTTTWKEWKRRHPETSVLSLQTGHDRDYGEGVAYQEYFGSDRLMFNTPFNDKRLDNKQEVLALRFAAAPDEQLAIDTAFLDKNQLFYENIGTQEFVVLTDDSGANRVFQAGDVELETYDGKDTAKDKKGIEWQVTETALIASNGKQLERLPYHRAFWFGWHAAYPETRLIK